MSLKSSTIYWRIIPGILSEDTYIETGKKERMLEGKAQIKETDMPLKMQIHAMASASGALDIYDVTDYTSIAAHIKKVCF